MEITALAISKIAKTDDEKAKNIMCMVAFSRLMKKEDYVRLRVIAGLTEAEAKLDYDRFQVVKVTGLVSNSLTQMPNVIKLFPRVIYQFV
jgi:hypothetical protein